MRRPFVGPRDRTTPLVAFLALYAVLSLFASVGTARAAEPLDPKNVPEPLKPWTAWVLDGKEDALCPTLQGQADVVRCAWPARLDLVLDEHGGHFSQSWHLDTKGGSRRAVPLPGDEKR